MSPRVSRFSQIQRNCAECGKPLKIRSTHELETAKWCSPRCRQLGFYKNGIIKSPTERGYKRPKGTHYPPKKNKICESCHKEYRPVQWSQRWCKECAKDSTSRSRLIRYGMTNIQYEEILNKQNNECAICGIETEIMDVDHNHSTGKIRGLLCPKCNHGLHFIENQEWLRRAIEYVSLRQ